MSAEYAGHARTGMFSAFRNRAGTRSGWSIMDEWHSNDPQDLVAVALCFQKAINKMHLCLLSMTYACPHHTCSHAATLMRTWTMQMSISEKVSDSLCRISLVMQTDCCSSCLGDASSLQFCLCAFLHISYVLT